MINQETKAVGSQAQQLPGPGGGQMNKMQEIEKQFRELNEEIVKKYEDELRDQQAQRERSRKELQEYEKEFKDILRHSKIDVDRLEELERKDAQNLKEYLKEVRPRLVGRPTMLATDVKEHSMHSWISSQTGSTLINPYGASMLVPDKGYLEGIQGEIGNGWIFPYNPEEINIKKLHEGSGWGCWGGPWASKAVEYNVWFNFVPDKTATWDLLAVFAFHGFYILRANDTAFTCKRAGAWANVYMNVYQYSWHGWKSFELIDKEDDNINLYEFYDKTEWFGYTAKLKGGDSTWVRLQIWINAGARGGGSYGEVNFSDGAANYIKPLLLSVQSL